MPVRGREDDLLLTLAAEAQADPSPERVRRLVEELESAAARFESRAQDMRRASAQLKAAARGGDVRRVVGEVARRVRISRGGN
jgi:hypothetical protein